MPVSPKKKSKPRGQPADIRQSLVAKRPANDLAAQLRAAHELLGQRTAELAVINTVQEGLASKLDIQAIYDLVGNKIREIFDADVVATSDRIVTGERMNDEAVRRAAVQFHG